MGADSFRRWKRSSNDGVGGQRSALTTKRHSGTRPMVRRMQTIDQAQRERKWPTGNSLARDADAVGAFHPWRPLYSQAGEDALASNSGTADARQVIKSEEKESDVNPHC
jgi:hypothetical protein